MKYYWYCEKCDKQEYICAPLGTEVMDMYYNFCDAHHKASPRCKWDVWKVRTNTQPMKVPPGELLGEYVEEFKNGK